MYTSKLVLLLVLAVAVLHFGGARLHLVEAQGNVQVIQLGASLTLTQTPPTARLSSGLRTRDGMLLFMEKQHEEPLVIGNTTYIFNITILDDQGTLEGNYNITKNHPACSASGRFHNGFCALFSVSSSLITHSLVVKVMLYMRAAFLEYDGFCCQKYDSKTKGHLHASF
jgi:hypothetical protein